MAYLDLSEIAALKDRCKLFSGNRWGPVSFLERDHLMTPGDSLDREVRQWYEMQTGQAPTGAICLLTLLRNWGYYFSPLSLYYIYKPNEPGLEGIVAEVSNTPWREKHRYLLKPTQTTRTSQLQVSHTKQFHVSPFMGMDTFYHWQCTLPEETLQVTIRSEQAQDHFFTAHLSLERKPFTDHELARALCRSPWSTARIVSNIYWQAFNLWWKKCPFYPHPKKRAQVDASASQA